MNIYVYNIYIYVFIIQCIMYNIYINISKCFATSATVLVQGHCFDSVVDGLWHLFDRVVDRVMCYEKARESGCRGCQNR